MVTWALIIFGLLLPAGIGYTIGRGRDRGGLGFALGLLLSWLGVVIALLLTTGGARCPACAEHVKREATVCKHCGTEFTIDEGWWTTRRDAVPGRRGPSSDVRDYMRGE